MKIKKFVASSMTEAMNLIKKEFGDEAIILNTKNIKPENGSKKNILEVTAAIEQTQPEKKDNALFNQRLTEATTKSEVSGISNFQFNVLKKEVDYISERLDLMVNHIKYENLPHIPKLLQTRAKKLIKNEVHPSMANSIIETVFTNLKGEELLEEDLIDEKILLKIKSILQVSDKTQKRALKRAFDAAYNNQDLVEKINLLQNYDLILIDTAGMNPKEMKKMIQMKELIRLTKADEIHLILSSTTKESDMRDVIKNYSVIPFKYLIFSKLDETNTFGSLLNIASDIDKPISYLTYGQSIPDDFILADRTELAKTILRGKYGIL